VLVDDAAAALDRVGQPAREAQRMDRRAMRGVDPAEDRGRLQVPAAATSSSARASWAGVRATAIVPPLAKWQSMPSAAATRPTSSTVSRIACCWASAPSRSASAARPAALLGNSAEHQPPLRPDAPNPVVSASSTTTRSEGSAASR
jgi:hypothetical protein